MNPYLSYHACRLRDRSRLPENRRPPSLHRHFRAEDETTVGSELARDPRLAAIEAALMAADEPLTLRRLAVAAGLNDQAEMRRDIEQLRSMYERDGSAFNIEELAGGFQLLTRPEFHPWLARLRRASNEVKLSAAARETLAIVAYRQPITRADVEAIRGVQSAEMLHQLMEKGFVRITGRDDSLGRPVLYGTTRKFLQAFGLRNLRDLPLARDLIEPGKKKKKSDDKEVEE
jgi:segregation and condensation protein B